MSMLSSQADELRTLADKLRIVSFDDRANYVENVGTLYRAMDAMREAADTITSLWNSLTASEAALNKAAGNWAKADAELGSGTCEMHEDIGATQTLLTCSECGYTTRDYSPIFCGGCGARIRRVVDE